MQLIDLSQTITPDMPLFSESAPKPEIRAWMTHAEAAASGRYQGCSCEITQVAFVTSLSTYLDAPYHFDPQGPAIDRLPLEACVLPGVCVDARPCEAQQEISAELFAGLDVAGKAALVCTGWSAYWGQPGYHDYPFLGAEAAQYLRDAGAKLVGVDTLVGQAFAFHAAPVKVAGAAAFPVRAYAVLP